jgi:predicted nucleic acid-binding protein
MTFVDANVFVYAVGNPHPLKDVAQAFFETSVEDGTLLGTSADWIGPG